MNSLTRFPIALVPTDFKFQPVDPGEVADYLVAHLEGEGYLPEFGGPEILNLGMMAKTWLQVRELRRVVWRFPLPGGIAQGFRRGYNTNPQAINGQITWAEWLRRTYGKTSAPPNR